MNSRIPEVALPDGRRRHRRRWSALFLAFAVVLGVFAGMPAASADPGDVGYAGPLHPSTGTPTGTKRAESVLWFNDGLWWANMWDESTDDFYIYRWNTATMTWAKTPTRVDTRANTHVDALWDGSRLMIASHGVVADGSPATSGYPATLFQYTYSSSTKTYTLERSSQINNMKTETLTIDKDSTGNLWATWMQGNQIYFNRTTTSAHSAWTQPAPVPNAPNVSVDDNSALIAYNGYIGILWSSQSATAPDGVYFSIHKDGTPDTSWSAKPIVAYQAPKGSDDHMNLKWLDVSGGQIYAAVKTSFTSGSQALLQLLVFDVATLKWRAPYMIARQSDCPNRVILLIDEAKGLLRTFATYPGPDGICSTSGGAIYEKDSPLNAISFPSGKGTMVINDQSSQVVHNSTSTKQNIRPGMGVAVLADNNANKQYWTFYEPPAGAPPVDTTPPDTTITSAAPTTAAPSFTFTSSEANSTYECQLDGSAFAACTSPKTYSGLAPGQHTFSVRAKDAAGNTDGTPASQTWTVGTTPPPDTTAPETTLAASGPSGTVTSTDASFAFSSNEAGTFQCQLDSAAVTTCTSPQSYSGLAPGQHTFSVRATDTAGNADATPATRTWTVSTTTPPPGNGIARAGTSMVATTTAASSVTVPLPAGTAAGDVLVSCLTLNGGTVRTAPAGWTQLAAVTASSNPKVYGYYKVAAAGETAPTWALSASMTSGAGITRYTGASGVDGAATTASGAAAASGTVPAVTTTTANAMLVGCMGVNSSSTGINSPAGMTQAFEVGGKKGEMDDGLQAAAGSSGTRTWTFGASREWAGWLVALRAA